MEVLEIQTFAVSKKKPENLSMPVEIAEAVRPLVQRAGERRKWVVYSAALLSLLEQPESEIRKRLGEVAAADQVGDFKELVQRAVKRAGGSFHVTQGGIDAVRQRRRGGPQSDARQPNTPDEEDRDGSRRGPRG